MAENSEIQQIVERAVAQVLAHQLPKLQAELVQRVLASSHFQKFGRHRDFLAHVTERILRDPGVEIHEQEIASKVFLRLTEGAKRDHNSVATTQDKWAFLGSLR